MPYLIGLGILGLIVASRGIFRSSDSNIRPAEKIAKTIGWSPWYVRSVRMLREDNGVRRRYKAELRISKRRNGGVEQVLIYEKEHPDFEKMKFLQPGKEISFVLRKGSPKKDSATHILLLKNI